MRTICVAPHADDEVLGCGGTLLKRVREGAEVSVVIVTLPNEDLGWDKKRVEDRVSKIKDVAKKIGVKEKNLYFLRLPAAALDSLKMGEIIGKLSDVFKDFEPNEVLLPHGGDIHSDHSVVYRSVLSCTKWFRYPSVKRIMCYETPSETDFGLNPAEQFVPNTFVDITHYFEEKLEVMKLYSEEMGEFPFPRSVETLESLANLRGSQSGVQKAEAFFMLRQFIE